MKREFKDLLIFLARPSIAIAVLIMVVYALFNHEISLFGFSFVNSPFLHHDLTHLVSNLVWWIPLSFLNENKNGIRNSWFILAIGALFISLSFYFPFAPEVPKGDTIIGLSALVCLQAGVLFLSRRKLWALCLSMVVWGGAILPSLNADSISRYGHAMGAFAGIILGSIVSRRLNRSP